MVTPIELTQTPTYTLQTVTANIGSAVVESATALASRKGVTFRNEGASNLYITSGAAATAYITLLPYDSVVYIMTPANPTTVLFYFAVPASGSAVVEREEWL